MFLGELGGTLPHCTKIGFFWDTAFNGLSPVFSGLIGIYVRNLYVKTLTYNIIY